MSESQTALAGSAGFAATARQYQLSDDLAKLCLPQQWKDSYRTLAWVNSICALFLLVGLVGLKAPKVYVRPLAEVQETVPVVFTPEEPPPPPVTQPDTPPEETQPDTPMDTPQVATVVAIANPAAAAFPVPVQGANIQIATEVHKATAPPLVTQQQAKPSAPTIFTPHAGEGTFPPPEYPAMAQRNRYQGTVIVEIKVDANGTITSATVYKSSGYSVLDEAALQVVLRRWRFTPGKDRWLHWPCQFKMQ